MRLGFFSALNPTASHVPYAMMLASSLSWLTYGWVVDVPAVLVSNGVGALLSTLMAAGYLRYCVRRQAVLPHFVAVAVYVCALASLAAYLPADTRAVSVGLVASCVAVLMFASPLATVRTVVTTQSSESLPAGMVLVGLGCTTLWTVYGLHVGDPFMYGPNGLAFCMGLVQVALLLRFPAKRSELPT